MLVFLILKRITIKEIFLKRCILKNKKNLMKDGLNLMKATELLDNSYFNILDDIRELKWSQF